MGSSFTSRTKRQQIYELLLTALSRKEIAYKLGMSESSVKYHEMRIFHQFGVSTRLQLLAKHLELEKRQKKDIS